MFDLPPFREWGRSILVIDFLGVIVDVDLTEDHDQASDHLVEGYPNLKLALVDLGLSLTCLEGLKHLLHGQTFTADI